MGPKLFTLPDHGGLIVAGIIILVYFAFRFGPLLFSKNRAHIQLAPGTPRSYGLGGGAVCPRCRRPFALGLFELKFGWGTKIARCPFCGKWSLVSRLGVEELRAAEAAELADAQPAQPVTAQSDEDLLKKRIDESRFTDRS